MDDSMDLHVPVVNIAPLLNGDAAKCSEVIKDIDHALQTVGFFYISGYTTDTDNTKKLFEVGKQIFDLPSDIKKTLSIKNSKVYRGYVQKGDDVTSNKEDIKEGIYFGHELLPGEKEDENMMRGRNLYPSSMPSVSNIVNGYIERMTTIGNAIVRALAVNLGQDEHFFDGTFLDPFPLLALWKYPPHPENLGDWGIGPHTDYGVITFILQDDVGGLQAQTRDGVWVDVSPRPGTQVVLLGDVLEIWTRGYYKSVMHRVKNSPTKTRLSVPFFHQPSANTIIKPLDISLISDLKHAKPSMPQTPFQFGRYVRKKFESSYLK